MVIVLLKTNVQFNIYSNMLKPSISYCRTCNLLYCHLWIDSTAIYLSALKIANCTAANCRSVHPVSYMYLHETNYYCPLVAVSFQFFISALSFSTFAVSPELPQNRLQLSFTLLLTSVTFKFVINQSLPKISYLTYMVSLKNEKIKIQRIGKNYQRLLHISHIYFYMYKCIIFIIILHLIEVYYPF